jgi:uncharacterized membrane protein required for colicin V production
MELVKDLTGMDWILLALLAAGLVHGWVRGFVGLLAGLIAYLAAIVIAGRYTPAAVAWLDRSWGTTAKLASVLRYRITLPPEAERIPASALPWEKVMEWLAALPLPESYKMQLAGRVQAWSEAGAHMSASEFIMGQLAAGMVSAAVFLLLAGALGYALGLVGRLISGYISELPIVGLFNRLLGGATGLAQAAVFLSILLSVGAPLFGLKLFSQLADVMGSSRVAGWLIGLYAPISRLLFGQGGEFFFRN